VREKEGTGPFECYLTVIMMNGHQIEAAANVRLMLTEVGFDEVSCTAHSMNVRHNNFCQALFGQSGACGQPCPLPC
jgi:hypothetical protein